MAVWSAVDSSELGPAERIDPEYYRPDLLGLLDLLEANCERVVELGDLIESGTRVVYQATDLIEDPDDKSQFVRFLQASDIGEDLPLPRTTDLGWVSRSDWEEYPKGRIRQGEILIEVKGKVEKVAIVPSDFPAETLVSGSLYKLVPDSDQILPRYLVAYLLSRFGRGFRTRSLTNTLIGYVNKGELYSLPVPVPDMSFQREVASAVQEAISLDRSGEASLSEAEHLLREELLSITETNGPEKTYVVKSDDTVTAERLDAEYFQPAKTGILNARAFSEGEPLSRFFDFPRDRLSNADPNFLVRNYDLSDALNPFLDQTKEVVEFEDIGSSKVRFQPGDLVVSRLRIYLKEIALVLAPDDPPPVGSSEFIVLRPESDDLSAETVLVYLRSEPIQTILRWSQDGSNHPRFHRSELKNLPVPSVLLHLNDEITELVRTAIRQRQKSIETITHAIALVEDSLGLRQTPTVA